MENIKRFIITVFIILIPALSFSDEGKFFIKIIQGNNNISVKDMQVVKLKKQTFHLIFPAREYDVQEKAFHSVSITASANNNIFKIKDGLDKNQIPFFCTGTGIAGYNGEYPYLLLSDTGNHYIMYSKKDADERRATLIFDFNDIYEVSWSIKKIWINMETENNKFINYNDNVRKNKNEFEKSTYKIENFPLDKIYLIAYSDSNLNNIIDKNEYIRFTIEFSE